MHHIGAGLLVEQNRHRPLAIGVDTEELRDHPDPHIGDIHQPNYRTRCRPDNGLLHIVEPVQRVIGHDEIEQIVILHPSHRLQRVGGTERVHQVVQREMKGGEPPRIGAYFDFGGVAALHLRLRHARYAGEQRHQLIGGERLQFGRR